MSDICVPPLNDIWNKKIITQKSFPNKLKQADVTHVFKKGGCVIVKELYNSKCSIDSI